MQLETSTLIVFLVQNPGVKSREIAKVFGASVREINQILYANLGCFEVNEDYEWSLKAEYSASKKGNEPDGPVIPFDIHEPNETIQTENWDAHQRLVIELDGSDLSLVEAGPGSGKTAVACARVSYLIDHLGLEPSKILLISFTRTAIKELRERIQSHSKDPSSVVAVQMCTLDSFTWQALAGVSDDDNRKLFDSFDANISLFIERLRSRDRIILDYFEEFEHVLIDEGQDLVGKRAELVLEILRSLQVDCGVTIFADSAQAIYGFTVEESKKSYSYESSLLTQLASESVPEFQFSKVCLSTVYRTKDKNLINLFVQGRRLLNEQDSTQVDFWKSFRSFIESCAHSRCNSPELEGLEDCSDTLVLYRTKAEVLYNSSKLWNKGIIHKIRMSKVSPILYPWIGRVFSTYTQNHIERSVFFDRWSEHVNGNVTEAEDAWRRLVMVTGLESGKLSMSRVRELLVRARPPLELVQDESESRGPVLSTIHASKGREAASVHFMLPSNEFIDSKNEDYKKEPYEIAEECRVLFVGSTRAKSMLRVGHSKHLYASVLKSGRVFKSVKTSYDRRMVQIGMSGDIDIASLLSHSDVQKVAEIQQFLWNSSQIEKFSLEYCNKAKRYKLLREDGLHFGFMSRNFGDDMLELGRRVANKLNKSGPFIPSTKINHLKMTGVVTIVIPEFQRSLLPEPWRHSGIALAPVISGFPTIFFN